MKAEIGFLWLEQTLASVTVVDGQANEVFFLKHCGSPL